MKSKRLIRGAALIAFALCCSSAEAQLPGGAARQRYENRTKGANLDDYVKKLDSSDADTRLQAVKSLGETHDSKAVDYLLQAVGDSDVRVRAKAISMLGNMRATEATPVLIQYLFMRTVDPQMKNLVLAALGQIGDPRAARPILDFLQRDLDHDTRGTAIFALGEINSPEAEEGLKQIADNESDPMLRRLASEGLAKVKYQEASRSAEANKPSETFLDKDKPPAP